MELVDVIKVVSDISMAGLVAILFMVTWRSRDREGSEQSRITQGLIQLLADTSANTKACADAIKALDTREGETHTLLIGMRREVGLAHGDQAELLGELRTAIQEVPTATALEVETRIGPRFATIQGMIGEAAFKLLSASTQIDVLAKLVQAGPADIHARERQQEPGEVSNQAVIGEAG